ncbi:PglL family O-oligosaccharyltransferase [Psychromonas antarctica]|uniref:PglL family O-oligosaccharyltransferase n=1 Tax=Psychromonas antarctica TaxID=67573 RepID=UPI001EE8B9BE|nr:PglL family O-oligosaccharyltransferase [Psychromonas antarctica]MCG6200762.1 PglL family O-oligosaccharyltransferase [Psychromonas antarctica]
MDLEKKLTRAFFVTFALLMGLGAHYFQHNQGGSGLELAQNNVVWIFFSILIGLGLWKITVQKKIVYSRFSIVFLAAFLLFLLPVFYPNNALADQSYTRLLGLFAGFLLFVSLQQFQFKREQIQRLLVLIVLAGFLQACYSLTQDYLLPANNYFGYDIGYGRPYGIFQQPNVLASFMATTLILAGYLLQQITNKKLQLFLLITVLLNMWVITITMSRTGYLGVLIAVLLFIPWAWQSNKKRLAIFLLALLLGLGFAMIKGDALAARNVDNLKEGGIRLTMYQHSWQMIKENPLMGYGYGGFEKNYLITQAALVKKGELTAVGQQLTHPHNDTLFWAVEGGILPIVAILLLVISFLRLLRVFKLPRALVLLALVTPIALHTQTEYPLYHSALHWLVLIVVVFYISNEAQHMQNKNFPATFALRIFALLIPLFTAIFMITNLYTISKITAYERSKQPDIRLLLDIVNPLVFEDRFNFHLNYFRLSMAHQLNKPEDIQKVIDWTEAAIETSPKSFLYIILYAAYMNNNQPEKAQQVLDYARYLYPLDPQLANAGEPLKALSSAASTVSHAIQTGG